jgi:predicted helicase
MENLFSGNIALNSAKYGRQLGSFNYFVTQNITSKDLTSSIDSVNTFPLYIITSDLSREVNFTSDFKKTISSFQKSVSNEDILGYIYAILHSLTYRSKYAEFLKIDFPRIPFTEDKKVFKQLSKFGSELINVHLLRETELGYSFGEFLGKGDSIVEKLNYVTEKKIGKLYINKTQYFNDVPQHVYDFYIGGYQVLDKYLKERKGRKLTYDEAGNVEKAIRAIVFTIEQMNTIDKQTKNWI